MFPIAQMIDEEDHEARSAMHELFRAEEIKMSDDGLLDRIVVEIDRKVGILSKIRDDLPDVIEMDDEDEDDDPQHGSRGFEDFLSRLRAKEDLEAVKTNESPAARRRRIRGA